jgi:uncharacterized protein (TIGR02444 family)
MIIGADSTHMTDTNPFWEFSITFYARPGVATLCLDLQQRCEADVNLLLFCLWRADNGQRLHYENLCELDAEIAPWRVDVVQPLRGLRQQLRDYPAVESTRDLLKKAELESERVQQQAIWKWQQRQESGVAGKARHSVAECIGENLAGYAALLAVDPAEFDSISALALANFSDAS